MLKVVKLQPLGLEPISFTLDGGQCLAVRGPSGSGKTLLLRALVDLDEADGNIFWNDRERGSMSAADWRLLVRYAPAEPGWWRDTPAEHFTDIEKAALLAQKLGLDAKLLHRSIADLSTGERQRLALARAVIDEPPVLAFDEPTAALDGEARELAERLISAELARGCAVIIVTHNDDQAQRLASRQLIIGNGKYRLEDIEIKAGG